MSFRELAKSAATLLPLLCVILVPFNALADDVSDLRRMILELQQQNLDLARRVSAMEAAKSSAALVQGNSQPARVILTPPRAMSQPVQPYVRPHPVAVPPMPKSAPGRRMSQPAVFRPIPKAPSVHAMPQQAPLRPAATGNLEERVRELEIGQDARDQATRAILRDSLSKIGPQINETAALGGSLEVEFGKSKSFSGPRENSFTLSTVELEFDLTMNEWVTGSMILAYDPGTDVTFTASDGSSREVDRFVADRAMISLGNTQLFPLYAKLGRDTLPFGTSTGLSRTSSLSIASPLTIEAFEARRNSMGIGFAVPTPKARPPSPPIVVPDVKPLVLSPLVGGFARLLGYKPAAVPPPKPTPVFLPPDQPSYYGSIHLYEGSSDISSAADFTKNINASLGYRTKGHCGRPYSELQSSFVCPWTFDMHVDYNTSIYNSNFLRRGYQKFLGLIGRDPGAAASVKMSAGPFALIAEYNEVLKRSTFVDDSGATIQIRPAAWQVSLGYQFDWNPWVAGIGEQGTFIALGYSRTRNLAGVTQLVGGEATRFGAAPKQRAIVTAGEWVTSDLKLAMDFLVDWDYSSKDGGTGERGFSIFTSLSYNF